MRDEEGVSKRRLSVLACNVAHVSRIPVDSAHLMAAAMKLGHALANQDVIGVFGLALLQPKTGKQSEKASKPPQGQRDLTGCGVLLTEDGRSNRVGEEHLECY